MKNNKVLCEISRKNQQSTEVQQLEKEFPNLFRRNGRVKNHEIKIEMKEAARIHNKKAAEFQFSYKSK